MVDDDGLIVDFESREASQPEIPISEESEEEESEE
jgi:hypothetical protein